MRKLRLDHEQAVQQYRRMIFNIIARNQDDHTRNIAFTMDNNGGWALSPAYDVTYCYNPIGEWTSLHQMTINGKRDSFTRDELVTVGQSISINKPERIIEEVLDSVSQFGVYAKDAGVEKKQIKEISSNHRLGI